jgi:hypothetical protein
LPYGRHQRLRGRAGGSWILSRDQQAVADYVNRHFHDFHLCYGPSPRWQYGEAGGQIDGYRSGEAAERSASHKIAITHVERR